MMSNAYRTLMDRQKLSKEAEQRFMEKLMDEQARRRKSWTLRTGIAVVCVLLLIPVSISAVESIFGFSVVKLIKGETSTRKTGTGYEVTYPEMSARSVTDLSEEIRELSKSETVVMESWQQAEETLGIVLVNNPVFKSEKMKKQPAYDLSLIGLGKRVHCFAGFEEKDGQLYRATITAAYRYDHMDVTLQSTVTCEHPAVQQDEEPQMPDVSVLYEDRAVAQITQEQYVAQNGVQATIVAVERTKGAATKYEAGFAADGAAYRVTISPHDPKKTEEARKLLTDILEGFVFG